MAYYAKMLAKHLLCASSVQMAEKDPTSCHLNGTCNNAQTAFWQIFALFKRVKMCILEKGAAFYKKIGPLVKDDSIHL